MSFKNSFAWLVTWAQGRHTLFAVFFAITGFYLQLSGRLNGEYIALIGAVQTFILVHSAKEDYFESKSKDQNLNGGGDSAK